MNLNSSLYWKVKMQRRWLASLAAAAVLACVCKVDGNALPKGSAASAFHSPPKFQLQLFRPSPANSCPLAPGRARPSLSPPPPRAGMAPARGRSGIIGGRLLQGLHLRRKGGLEGMRCSASPLIDEIFATPGVSVRVCRYLSN